MMIKKQYIILFLLLITNCSLVFSQGAHRGEKKKKLHAIKIAFITEEVSLTEKQAEQFWPIYNMYSSKKKTIRRELRSIKQFRSGNLDTYTEAEITAKLNRFFELKQQEIDLDKEYKTKLLTVISAKQLLKLYEAEKKFLHQVRASMKGQN